MQKILLAILFFSIVLGHNAFAVDRIEIDIDTTIEPTEAIGFIISPTGTDQRLDTTWAKTIEGVVTVSVPLQRGDRSEGNVVTAMIKGHDGAIAFGNTKPAWIPTISATLYSLPECAQRKAPKGLELEVGLIRNLAEIRSARRSGLQLKIVNLLKGDLSKKLLKLERGFGMEQGKPLDGTLPPLELEDRLFRLEQAIINYRAQKRPTTATSAEESETSDLPDPQDAQEPK